MAKTMQDPISIYDLDVSLPGPREEADELLRHRATIPGG